MAHSIQSAEKRLSEQEIQILSQDHIQTLLQGDPTDSDIVLAQLKASEGWLEAWKKEFQEIIKHLCESETPQEQKVALRKESLVLIENCTITQPFLREGLSDEEVKVLLKHRHPDLSTEEAMQAQYQIFILSDASLRCLRQLSALFSDAEEEDWYDLCFEIHQQHISHLFRQTIAHLTGEEYQFDSLVGVMGKMIDEVEEKVLDGKTWNFKGKLEDVRQFHALQQQNAPLGTTPNKSYKPNPDPSLGKVPYCYNGYL
jgi:hypothetical protein